MRFGIITSNPTIGDFTYNAFQIVESTRKAKDKGAQLLITSEFSLSGLPANDLLFNSEFINQCHQILETLNTKIATPVIIGHPEQIGTKLYNAASLIFPNNSQPRQQVFENQPLDSFYFKKTKYFEKSDQTSFFTIDNLKISCLLGNQNHKTGSDKDSDLIINIESIPFFIGKSNNKNQKKMAKPLIYINSFGGQNEWVFDGMVYVINPNQPSPNNLSSWSEEVLICGLMNNHVTLDQTISNQTLSKPEEENHIANIYQALKNAIGDYINKNYFKKVFIGLSGGIDSAVVASITQSAINQMDNVVMELIMMPSQYTSKLSMEMAQTITKNLNCKLHFCPIDNYIKTITSELQPLINLNQSDFTLENLQARVRAIILMTFANQDNGLVVNTSNRSEGAVGYGTLYGDLIGGYALLKDLYKYQIYQLAKFINDINHQPIIPQEVITRAPSAELRADQKDEDSIPAYELLDKILFELFENQKSPTELIRLGYSKQDVQKTIQLYYQNEYKRRQFPLGLNLATNPNNCINIPVNHRFIEFGNE